VTDDQTVNRPAMNPRELVPLDNVRNRLAWIWIIGFGLIVTIMVIQSLLNVYKSPDGDLTQEAWSWLLPTLLPSVGLIITVLTYTALDPLMTGSVVRRSFVPIAIGVSIFYLLLVLLTILAQPFASHTPKEAVAAMHTSNLWLGPIQGLVASAIGVLFASRDRGAVRPEGEGR
jgi:hypothetical protein